MQAKTNSVFGQPLIAIRALGRLPNEIPVRNSHKSQQKTIEYQPILKGSKVDNKLVGER